MLPGVEIVPYYDRKELTNLTTHTVVENLLIGMGLVFVILLIFLGNVRTAVIVAINIPLALLFAFSALFLRGKSANLLSIGAVDFGIIVDSSVIITENIYRRLVSGEDAGDAAEDPHLPRGERDRPRTAVFHADHGLRVHSAVRLGGSGGALCSDPWRRPTPPRWPGRWCWP